MRIAVFFENRLIYMISNIHKYKQRQPAYTGKNHD